MAWSGRQKHRDRASRARSEEAPAEPPAACFRISRSEREQIARALRHIDEARVALEAQHDARNRLIVRELRASADRIFDLINGLEEQD
jgi:hypothetical protein